MSNIFAGGPIVNESLEKKEKDQQTLTQTPEGEQTTKDIFGSFSPKNQANVAEAQIAESRDTSTGDSNPEDILSGLENDTEKFEDNGFREARTKEMQIMHAQIQEQGLNKEKIVVNEKIKESLEYPLIEGLYKNNRISEDTFNLLVGQLEQKGKIDTQAEGFSSNEEILLIDSTLKKLQEQKQNKDVKEDSDFVKDIEKVEEFSIYKEAKTPTIEHDIFNLIGKNYVKIGDGRENYDVKGDLQVAIKQAKNEILNNNKTLNKDMVMFKVSITDIEGDNLSNNLQGLQNLFLLASASAGFSKLKGKDADLNKKYKEFMDGELGKSYDKKIQELTQRMNTEKDQAKRKEIEDLINSLQKEIETVKSGEVYNGSILDISLKNIENKESK